MSAEVRRGAVVTAAVGAALLVAAFAGGRPGTDGPPLDPRSDGPLGTSALVSLLRGLDAQVDLSPGLPSGDEQVAVLLVDRLDGDQRADVVAWIERGGRLVVTDPRSPLTPPVADEGLGAALDALASEPLERDSCTVEPLTRLATVAAGDAVRYDVPSGAAACFGDGTSAYIVAQRLGAGDVVAVGGAAALTNELLDERDNAVLAATLLAPEPGTSVRFVDPPLPAGGGQESLAELVPHGVRRALLQLAAAFLVYAIWRAIRLGRPVPEEQPVRIAGSALVAATGRLLSRTGSPSSSAEILRSRLRRSLRARLGLPVTADPALIAGAVASRTGIDQRRVLDAVADRPVGDDGELARVARAVSSIHQEVLR